MLRRRRGRDHDELLEPIHKGPVYARVYARRRTPINKGETWRPAHHHGPNPRLDIEDVTKENDAFRDTLWTGHLQMTVILPVEIGAEVHDDHDQFLRLRPARAAMIGDSEDKLDIDQRSRTTSPSSCPPAR